MDRKAALLNDLRIERECDAPPNAWPSWTWAIGAGLAVLAAATAWWVVAGGREAPAPATVAVAVPLVEQPAAVPAASASTLDASGYVVARRQATVSAKITGRVVEILIEEGQSVLEGQILARLDDSTSEATLERSRAELAHAEAHLAAARVALADTEPRYMRNEQQFAAAVISAQDFDGARAEYHAAQTALTVKERAVDVARAGVVLAERQLQDALVRAPFDGVITVKAAQAGEIVSPSSAGGGFTRTGIGTIVDMDSLEVEVDVNESFINRVRPGQAANIRLNAYPESELAGEVIAVVPTANRARATVKVRVGLRERDERVLPEMGARVSFLTASVAQVAVDAGSEKTP